MRQELESFSGDTEKARSACRCRLGGSRPSKMVRQLKFLLTLSMLFP